GLLLLSVGGTWVCATAADWLAFRGDGTLTAILPPFVLYIMGAALGKDGFQLPTTFVFVVAALLFVAANHAAGLPTAWFSGRTAPEEFDGRIWSSRGAYRPVGGQLPKESGEQALTYKVVQDYRIGPLDSFWLPAAYRPGRVDLAGARVNAESLTLLTEKESAE